MTEFKIMRNYMIEINLPEFIDDKFVSLIPSQRDKINELMQIGIILTYSLSSDRSKLWISMIGENHNSIDKTLHTFPMYKYFNYKIIELAFHNNVAYRLPELSLN